MIKYRGFFIFTPAKNISNIDFWPVNVYKRGCVLL
jgi:hypothetical protein